jgi:uncharacterized protein YkwD
MKRVIVLIIIVFLIAAGFWYWQKNPTNRKKLDDITQSISQNNSLQDIKKEILTADPLRSNVNAPNARLTVAGVILWTNTERAQNNQAGLKENALLDQAAQMKLSDMFQKQYFEHISPDNKGPGDLAEGVNYKFIAIGENLALGNFEDDRALVEAWMNSPGHRANILNSKFTEIGVAVGKGTFEGKTVWLAVQEFGKPANACPSVNVGLKDQIQSYQTELSGLETEINQQKTWLEAANPKTKSDYEAYNQKVGDYNSLVKIYNNKLDVLKGLIADYNGQISRYNACLGE